MRALTFLAPGKLEWQEVPDAALVVPPLPVVRGVGTPINPYALK